MDLNVRTLREKDLAWADLVFVSGMIVQRESARELIARCKAAGKTIVAGGPLFTGEYEQFPEVDHFVLNEAEVTLPEFLATSSKGARRIYASASFRTCGDAGAAVGIGRPEALCDHVHSVFPRLPVRLRVLQHHRMFGHRPRVKTSAQVIAELDGLHLGLARLGLLRGRQLHRKQTHAEERLLPALIEWRKGKRGIAVFHRSLINLADDEPLMRTDGPRRVSTRSSSASKRPDEASLAECNKSQNRNRDLVADVKRIQRAGLQVQGGFIVGFDHDTPATFSAR